SAQDFKVSGKITSAKDGSELPGVNVRIKNTNRGTVANVMGFYELMVRRPTDTLVFSFIGFTAKEIIVAQRNTIDVQLEPDATELDEVVVTGFQEVERKLFTGSATSL